MSQLHSVLCNTHLARCGLKQLVQSWISLLPEMGWGEGTKGKQPILHADPEGYELHAEEVVRLFTLVDGSKNPKPWRAMIASKAAT